MCVWGGGGGAFATCPMRRHGMLMMMRGGQVRRKAALSSPVGATSAPSGVCANNKCAPFRTTHGACACCTVPQAYGLYVSDLSLHDSTREAVLMAEQCHAEAELRDKFERQSLLLEVGWVGRGPGAGAAGVRGGGGEATRG